MNIEKEIRELQQQPAAAVKRIGELEGSFGYISGQLPEVLRYLHENVDARLASLEGKVENGFASLRADLPGIVGDAVREVMRPQG
jgi:hypothetical protein